MGGNHEIAVNTAVRMCGVAEPERFLTLLREAGFSAEDYRQTYDDLIAGCPDAEIAMAHFLSHGIQERRSFPIELVPEPANQLWRLKVENPEYVVSLLEALTASHVGSWIFASEADQAIRKLRPLVPLRESGCRPFVVIGDSHSHLFRRASIKGPEWFASLHLLCSAGSALGLANPMSRSGYSNHIRHFVAQLEEIPGANNIPLLFEFGQVDVEFVYNFRRIRDKIAKFDMGYYEQFCAESVAAYCKFLTSTFPEGKRDNVFVLSIFPPALSDRSWEDGYINDHIVSLEADRSKEEIAEAVRQVEIPNISIRTNLHHYYNEELKKKCKYLGFSFRDCFTPFLGEGNVLDMSFVPLGKGSDHHLEYDPTTSQITEILWSIMETG